MADPPKPEYKLRSDEGFQGALVIWAVFILVLALLGIPALLCILFGACGAAGVWVMIAYWRADKLPEEATKSDQQEEEVLQRPKSVFERIPLLNILLRILRRMIFPPLFRPRSARRIGRRN